ncbi:hypothetical protein AN964_02390 [Heyndrickxia shackletonii]|uniref:Uncharacterized protein n=1 Tax=Heyndrickxia shackletonii TaxID=157838 RepID=A0A0Q3WVQ8_9BACI|nr:hypothetical protein [Heyndrickxia shackletonii]KQL52499.1 hypothetical protein AN964_02390 [Heyndrickxia shackletonii]NEZ02360.1 hypothetical protein [Heyndrickxia shackletonii]
MKLSNSTTIAIITILIFSTFLHALNKFGPFEGQLRMVGFSLFTLLCVCIGIMVRKSPWRMVGTIAYWLIFGLTQIIK